MNTNKLPLPGGDIFIADQLWSHEHALFMVWDTSPAEVSKTSWAIKPFLHVLDPKGEKYAKALSEYIVRRIKQDSHESQASQSLQVLTACLLSNKKADRLQDLLTDNRSGTPLNAGIPAQDSAQ